MVGQIPVLPRWIAGPGLIDAAQNLVHLVAEEVARLQGVAGVQHRPVVEVLQADRGGHVGVPAVHRELRRGRAGAGGRGLLDKVAEYIVLVIDRQLKAVRAVVMLDLGQLVLVVVGIGPVLVAERRGRVLLAQVAV